MACYGDLLFMWWCSYLTEHTCGPPRPVTKIYFLCDDVRTSQKTPVCLHDLLRRELCFLIFTLFTITTDFLQTAADTTAETSTLSCGPNITRTLVSYLGKKLINKVGSSDQISLPLSLPTAWLFIFSWWMHSRAVGSTALRLHVTRPCITSPRQWRFVHSVLCTQFRPCPHRRKIAYGVLYKQTNSVALSRQANYTGWSTATCRQNSVPTFADRWVSCGQRGGSHTVVNLSFLDQSR
jgi:hypothetical protein